MPHSVLVVPVPDLEHVVRPRLARRSPDDLAVDDETRHAHVTLLGPFAGQDELTDGMLGELADLFADVTPFEFTLTTICVFSGGNVYLSPEPAAPFRHLTHELSRHFPEYPPYGGEFDEVVPHLTVPLAEGENMDTLRFQLGARLPVTTYAREAALVWYEPKATRTLATFAFGTSAA